MPEFLSVKSFCSLLTFSFPGSIAGSMWLSITAMWSHYWLPLGIGLILWVLYELVTRNGISHYNSDNGFSPAFNRFVGSGTYMGLQALLYFVFENAFGSGVYCVTWPYAAHLIVFLSTGLLLHFLGFWPYLKLSGKRYRKK